MNMDNIIGDNVAHIIKNVELKDAVHFMMTCKTIYNFFSNFYVKSIFHDLIKNDVDIRHYPMIRTYDKLLEYKDSVMMIFCSLILKFVYPFLI